MWRVSPWWHSSSGYAMSTNDNNRSQTDLESRHGTLMARLIAGVCPSAIIHVIKLHTVHRTHSFSFACMCTERSPNLLHSLRHVEPQSSK